MSTPETKPAERGRSAVVVATAAVTLALGVTIAALAGYLSSPTEAPVATKPATTIPDAGAGKPTVVLVPVSNQPPGPAQAAVAPETVEPGPPLAEERRGHHDRDDDDDDDDDHHERRRGGHGD